jgi:MFS family permease
MKESAYKNYLLTVLLAVYAFNAVDRLALGLVLQNIKADLVLSDTQLGFLTGIAFALFYSTMGIPIARWADRGDRITIIMVTTALWSVMVALCGAAGSFVQLLLIRIGVAVGEAGCLPPAHSLIADHFTRAERPRAAAIYMMGSSLGVALGYFVAGWLNEFYGWRATFLNLGWPGLALAALAWYTLKEPRRATPAVEGRAEAADRRGEARADPPAHCATEPSLQEVYRTLWASTTFRHLLFCFSVISFFGYGIGQWQAAFFIRSFGLKTGELGTWFALIYGVGGLAGTYLGGEMAARYAANNERLQLRVMAVAFGVFGLVSSLIYISSNRYWAFGIMALAVIGVSGVVGPLFATIQSLVPDRMRALSIATIYLFANLIGMGLGPLATGALSDLIRPWAGDESLRYSLLALCPGYWWGAWHLSRSASTVTQELQARQA